MHFQWQLLSSLISHFSFIFTLFYCLTCFHHDYAWSIYRLSHEVYTAWVMKYIPLELWSIYRLSYEVYTAWVMKYIPLELWSIYCLSYETNSQSIYHIWYLKFYNELLLIWAPFITVLKIFDGKYTNLKITKTLILDILWQLEYYSFFL